MQANKLASPRRAVKEKQQENQHSHTVDFSIFRRKDSESVAESPENGIIVQRAYGLPAILAAFNLLSIKQQSDEQLFKDLEVINIPREYEAYLHEKTLVQFLKIFKEKFSSLSVIVDIINHYPIAAFFLQLFARQSALVYLQETSESENELMMGNEFQLLADMKSDLRGNALEILVKSLKLHLTVKYGKTDNAKFIRKTNTQEGQESESHGIEDYCASVELRRNGKELIVNLIDQKTNYVSTMRRSKIELLQRKSRIRQPESRNGTESRSIHKEKICSDCGMARCNCREKDLSGLVSSTNFSKSISGGFAQYGCKAQENTGISSPSKLNPLGMGFINMSKIVNREVARKG